MINYRKLKKDLSPNILKDGQSLYKKEMVRSVRITSLAADVVQLNCSVLGNYDNTYTIEVEINRRDSCVMDSDCDCPYNYDCQHLAAVLYYLEDHFDEILVSYSKEADPTIIEDLDDKEKEELLETFKEAEHKEVVRKGKKYEKELIQEYTSASEVLGLSPFFVPEEKLSQDKAELVVIFTPPTQQIFDPQKPIELKLALRVPYRSKPLNVLNVKEFLDAIRYHEALYIGNKRFFFGFRSFAPESAQILRMIMDFGQFPNQADEERNLSVVYLESEAFGTILAHAFDLVMNTSSSGLGGVTINRDQIEMPCFCCGTVEEALRISNFPAELKFELEYLEAPAPKLFLKPSVMIGNDEAVLLDQTTLFECAKPGLLHENVYFRFQPQIKRKHLRHLPLIRDITIPEPLFGTFVENSLPELLRIAQVTNQHLIERFVTLPYVGNISAVCNIQFLDGELEAALSFIYDGNSVPAFHQHVKAANILPFVTDEGILARNLTEEQNIIQDLFQDFVYDLKHGCYVAKNDKKIVEFMTEVVPRNQAKVKFNCPKNLLDKFIYDDTTFQLNLKETDKVDLYEVELKVNGELKGFTVDQLWDCLASKRSFIELRRKKGKKDKVSESSNQLQKILVLDLDKMAPIVQIFDELGLNLLDDHIEERPLWSLASISEDQFKDLPIKFSMTKRLKQIQLQMLGEIPIKPTPVPKEIKAVLREYQREGVVWLERLQLMHLCGILADDMGLGKTLQAIVTLTQYKKKNPDVLSLIVCPTSLVYNWMAELQKFNPKLKALVVDGTPPQRKKLIATSKKYDLVITSYSILQKDIELYNNETFGYAILDEAQHIKNRGTRNAKSVKKVKASHRLILTGTPIENSLEELWSLFDFLMPGLLSSYERFAEKYIRNSAYTNGSVLDVLRRKVSPFILRRMKKDVLSELPPVSHIVYHCHLSEVQKELYRSYADTAYRELSQLVKKEGFNKVQIQILATLTRLKQICCHPAIFAKESPEAGDSSKYDMLMELLQTLMEGGHKTVIFSQYTRMLQIMRKDLEQQGIRFCYLDGSTKDRMAIVNEFNEDKCILVFLVSLKAGGTGLNLVGADTVIHYDPWWNPATEDQATDRVHRIGQTANVSSYKLVTLGTIEEKILEMQNRKRGLVTKVISSDEEAMSKLTWEEVLELLKT
ncbi:MAG: RNA polymerase-associated protein RapA [Chlamydiae bacterium]|nr:RNA polymerase-associated protein RapA [Chlamydiota bacterium]